MRIPAHHTRSDMSENMMTSMIDVVFLLLIFFVCAAAGNVYELLLPTELAASGSVGTAGPIANLKPVDEVWVHLKVGEGGRTIMQLNGTDYESFDELREVLTSLAEIAPESPVILEIAPDVEAGQMVRVYDTCRAAHFESISFSARPPQPETSAK